jgi:hypothetical protein
VVQRLLHRENPYLPGARTTGADEGKVERLSDNLDDAIIQESRRPRRQHTDDDEERPLHLNIVGPKYTIAKEDPETEDCPDEEEEERVYGRNLERDDNADCEAKLEDVINDETRDRCHKLRKSVELHFIVDQEPSELKKEGEEHQRNRVRKDGGNENVVDVENIHNLRDRSL